MKVSSGEVAEVVEAVGDLMCRIEDCFGRQIVK